MEEIFKGISLINHGGRRSIAGTAQATPPHPPPTNTLPLVHPLSRLGGGGGGLESECTRGECWSGVVGQSCLSSPRYRPPTPMVIKENPSKCSTCKTSAGFFYMKISCKKFKNHLQFYMKIFLKKNSSFFTGKSLVKFFQNHTLENIFQKLSPRGCF